MKQTVTERQSKNESRTLMSAVVITQPGRAEVQQVPIPVPGPNEVRIKVQGCGVCASNIPPWEGRPWFNYPLEPGALGHEGWGLVDAVGTDVVGLEVGDRVTMLSYHAYAEYDVANASDVIPLPESLADMPFPGEPLGCAVNIFRRSDIHPGQTVAIVGVGFMGALLVQMASRTGARVIGIDRRPCALEIAKKLGAQETIIMDGHEQIIDQIKQLTQGHFCERTIEAVGKQWPLDLAGELTAVRGKLIVAGYHQDSPRQVNMQLWNWRGLDVINAHERDQQVYIDGIRAAIDAVLQKTLDPQILFTHTYSIDHFSDALNALIDRPKGFMKGLIVF